MMKKMILPMSVIIALVYGSGCKKNANPNDTEEDGSFKIHLAAQNVINENSPYYVKNGEPEALPTERGGMATSIYSNGYTIWVGGWQSKEGASSSLFPCYWENGERYDLPQLDPRPRAEGYVNAIAVLDGTIFAAGQAADSVEYPGWDNKWVYYPCYWKDNKIIQLEALDNTKGGQATDIALEALAAGQNVYIVGTSVASNGFSEPCYWAGSPVMVPDAFKKADPLSSLGYGGMATGVAVADGTMYISGMVNDDENQSTTNMACYWADGNRVDLVNKGEYLNSMAKDIELWKGTVYVVGYVITFENRYIPCIWKNGEMTELPLQPGMDSYNIDALDGYNLVNDCTIQNGDVYVTGGSGPNLSYWKNGELVVYEGVSGLPTAIAVTPN